MIKNKSFYVGLALGCLLAAFTASALADEKPWSGDGKVGFVSTGGNTDAETLNVGLNVNRASEKWEHSIGFAAVSASDSGDTTAERYELAAKSRRKVSEKAYWFGALRHQDDRFSGFEYQSSLAGGYGRILIDNEIGFLSAEAGAGYRRDKPVDGMGTEGDAIFQGGVRYERQIGATSKFANNFVVEAGENNTNLQNVAEVRVKINDRLSLAVGYELRHNTEVAPGIKNTDTLTTVNLVFGF